jgi:hypothetical protein
MKNQIKKIVVIVLVGIAITVNTSVLFERETEEKVSISSLIRSTSAQAEDPWNYPGYEEQCQPCTNEYGQSGMKFLCWFDWSWCHMTECGYGYC